MDQIQIAGDLNIETNARFICQQNKQLDMIYTYTDGINDALMENHRLNKTTALKAKLIPKQRTFISKDDSKDDELKDTIKDILTNPNPQTKRITVPIEQAVDMLSVGIFGPHAKELTKLYRISNDALQDVSYMLYIALLEHFIKDYDCSNPTYTVEMQACLININNKITKSNLRNTIFTDIEFNADSLVAGKAFMLLIKYMAKLPIDVFNIIDLMNMRELMALCIFHHPNELSKIPERHKNKLLYLQVMETTTITPKQLPRQFIDYTIDSECASILLNAYIRRYDSNIDEISCLHINCQDKELYHQLIVKGRLLDFSKIPKCFQTEYMALEFFRYTGSKNTIPDKLIGDAINNTNMFLDEMLVQRREFMAQIVSFMEMAGYAKMTIAPFYGSPDTVSFETRYDAKGNKHTVSDYSLETAKQEARLFNTYSKKLSLKNKLKAKTKRK